MKPIAKVYTAIIFLFLFAPIAILLVFSFNSGNSLSVFSGFSLYWYKELFQDSNTLEALRNTLVLALCAAILSTVLGTAASVGMNKLRSKYMRAAMNTVTNLPMVNPEIITGISLMLMFVFVGQMMGLSTSLNFGTILIAHVTFCLPFVILQVLPKLRQMDPALPEAAMDLGCNGLGVLRRVIWPLSLPGVISGVTMVLIPSVSTFYISQKLGDGKIMLIGDVIEGQYVANNLHFAAAIAFILMILLLVCMAVMRKLASRHVEGGL